MLTLSLANNRYNCQDKPKPKELSLLIAKQIESLSWQTMGESQLAKAIGRHGQAWSGMLLSKADVEPRCNKLANRLVAITAVALDFDSGELSAEDAIRDALIAGIMPWLVYRTLSSTPEHPRFRMVWQSASPLAGHIAHTNWLINANADVFKGLADKHALSSLRIWQGSVHGFYMYNKHYKLEL